MKTKDKKELHAKTIDELKQLILQTKEELLKLQLEKAQRKLKNTSSMLHKKKALAIIQTIFNEKRFANENA